MAEAAIDHWTVVLRGRWNVSILGPRWLAKHVFECEEVGLEFPLDPALPPKISSKPITVIPSSDRVVIACADDEMETLRRAVLVALKILELLPHTPVSAVGVNCAWTETPPSERITESLSSTAEGMLGDKGLLAHSRKRVWSLKDGTYDLNLECESRSDTSALVKFNFHKQVSHAGEACEFLKEDIGRKRDLAKQVCRDVFGIVVDGE